LPGSSKGVMQGHAHGHRRKEHGDDLKQQKQPRVHIRVMLECPPKDTKEWAVSVAMKEIKPQDLAEKVYKRHSGQAERALQGAGSASKTCDFRQASNASPNIHDGHGYCACRVRLAGEYAVSGSAGAKGKKEVRNGD
jgi:hypothetical protein